VHERLRRLLFLVPFVSKNPGLKVAEVARAMGISREQLLVELDLLTLVGRPPFQPDDFIDIYVEDDDRVFVHLDQRLLAPPRLTAAEGVALFAAAALLKPGAGDALSSALAKLEGVLPPEAVGRYRDMSRQLDVTVEGPDSLADLSRAIVEKREVELDYFTASRGQTEHRRVRPLELFNHRGQWYLSAHCLSRGDQRLFRLDRVASLAVTEQRFDALEEPRPRPMPSADASSVVWVRFSARAAPYIRERFGDDARDVGDGEVKVPVTGDSERWLTQWVLSFGGDATVTEPQWAIAAVARAAQASLQSR
jgi:proteasome accessory factor C